MKTKTAKFEPIRGVLAGAFFLLMFLPAIASVAQDRELQTPYQLLEGATERLREGRERYDRNSLEESVDLARRAIEGNPRYAEAYAVLGEAQLWLGSYQLAGQHLDTARRLGERGTDLDILIARLAVLEGRFEDARQRYRSVLAREPYNEDARIGEALLSLLDGSTTVSTRELQRLEQRFPRNRQLLVALVEVSNRRDDEAALERYLDLALRYHGESATVQLIAARSALERNSLQTADYHARNAVTIAPTLAEAWLILAETARRRGDLSAAITHYESLLRIDRENHRAWYARGVLAAATGNREMAVQSWVRAREIRPDYELPLLAMEHNAVDTLPLESDERRALAEPYRDAGRALEGRYLFRQAEQAYRRGLQIYPYDTELRRAIAELYRNQEMRARYLQELEVIDQLGGADREITDLIEVYRSVLADSVARNWGVDQFVADRPRTQVLLAFRDTAGTLEPEAGREIVEYIGSLLMSSQDIVVVTPPVEGGRSRAEIVAAGRAGDADLTIGIVFVMEDRRIIARYEFFEGSGVVPIETGTIARSGNGRIREMAREFTRRIEGEVPSQGYVLDRRFEEVLISLGAVDRLVQGDIVAVYTTPEDRYLGEATVKRVDDLVAVVEWTPTGTDDLGVGDRVLYLGPPPEEEGDTGTDGEEQGQPQNGTSEPPDPSFINLVQSLFRVR